MNNSVRYFNGCCYVCNGYGYKVVICEMNRNFRRNVKENVIQNGQVCYKCNVIRHIAKFCKRSKRKNVFSKNMVDSNSKGKNLWVKKIKENIE